MSTDTVEGLRLLEMPINDTVEPRQTPINAKNLATIRGWPYYLGMVKFHDLSVVMKNTPYIALTLLEELFSVINNQNVDLAYSNIVKTT